MFIVFSFNLVEEEAKPEPEEAKTETTECKYYIYFIAK
jgi:hypothetical protein